MTRLTVLTLVASLGLAAPVFAGDSVLATATRLTVEAAKTNAPPMTERPPAAPAARGRASRDGGAATQGQTPEGMLQSGMGKGKKILIGAVIAAAVVGVIYAIDHGVDDNTPSSQGLR